MNAAAALWTDLGGGVRVRQSRAYWMNSGLLLHPEHAVVIDPGVLPSELDELATAVHAVRPREVTLIFTHAHWDHVLGAPWFEGADLIAHARCADEATEGAARTRREAESTAAEHGEIWSAGFEPFSPTLEVSGRTEVALGPWRLVFRDAFGHCSSQVSVHVPERQLFFAADMLSDIEIPWLSGPPAVYQHTLEALLPLFEPARGAVETLVPGHGPIARGATACAARLARDLDYLTRLESGVRDARARGLSVDDAQGELEAMDYVGKNAEYSMNDVHRDNIRLAYESITTVVP